MRAVGFTGTRAGMSEAQHHSVRTLLQELKPEEVHHGDCVGADETFHYIAVSLGIRTVVHPPEVNTLRAWCEGTEMMPPKEYLARNRDIVNASEALIVVPRSDVEEYRSGTWATRRYAATVGKLVYIVWPGGETVQFSKGA